MTKTKSALALLFAFVCLPAACNYVPPGATTEPDAASSTGDSPDFQGVQCGPTVCYPPQVCCINAINKQRECTAFASCMGISATCDGPEDCSPTQICCGARINASAPITNVRCNASCEEPHGRLCHVQNAEADCLEGAICSLEFSLGEGFGSCIADSASR